MVCQSYLRWVQLLVARTLGVSRTIHGSSLNKKVVKCLHPLQLQMLAQCLCLQQLVQLILQLKQRGICLKGSTRLLQVDGSVDNKSGQHERALIA